MNDMNEDRLAYDRALRHQAMEWATSTVQGSFLHPDLVIERAEEFIGYVQNGWGRSDDAKDNSPGGMNEAMFTGEATVSWTPSADDYQLKARKLVYDQIRLENAGKLGYEPGLFDLGNVSVVWFCKTLQNWKALVSTTIPDDRYYEVTYSGDEHVAYIDQYIKVTNTPIKL